MIRGTVSASRAAEVVLTIRGPAGGTRSVTAVVDTGFEGLLALDPVTIAALGLVWQSHARVVFADGSVRLLDTYLAQSEWGGTFQYVLATVAGSECLVEMKMFDGYELRVECRPGGAVAIAPLPTASAGP